MQEIRLKLEKETPVFDKAELKETSLFSGTESKKETNIFNKTALKEEPAHMPTAEELDEYKKVLEAITKTFPDITYANNLHLLSSGYEIRQLRELIYGLLNDIDITVYADPSFSWRKMRNIRLCLQLGANPNYYLKS